MSKRAALVFAVAGLVLFANAPAATAQTDLQQQDAHHPAEVQGGADPQATELNAPAAESTPGGMSGMGMMTPEMMQMMHRMMGQGAMGMPGMMGGMTGQASPQGGMGGSMMAQGQPLMHSGAMTCPMMGTQASSMHFDGAAFLYGVSAGVQEEMTPERVRTFLEQRLAQHGNARLKLGEIATAQDGSITAEIVTVDGSLVQKLAFNRYPGFVRQIAQ